MDLSDAKLAPLPPKIVKPKREQTEAQKAATKANCAKGWEALKARREALAKAKEEGTEPPPPAPKKERVLIPSADRAKKRNPSHISVVHKELEELKSFVRDNMKPVDREVIKEVPVEKFVDREVIKEVIKEVPVERIVEREKVLSGSALLDKIFNLNR
jgi:hypothetical protein